MHKASSSTTRPSSSGTNTQATTVSKAAFRANAGAQYTLTFPTGGYVNALFGESYQLAGQNPYAVSDISNVGQQSGL